ncbi:DUF1294 domain-containing protein [Shewanella youngdeokensis]|uniref:DUF1294 domain-containing protein n=1 Tax=Shewanella youngdeokensis TaxID=2999068 RepID=A0ABZ0K1Y1_9GAMM|nr:DUF1294 domain-containing protein [Shewanella sp. DAU334]
MPKLHHKINKVSLFALATLIGIVTLHQLALIPLAALGYLLLLCCVTFIAYAVDKRAARQQRWRIKESTLHLLALLGGWPGALLAQQWLRHKSAKTSFKVALWLAILLNIAISYAVLFPALVQAQLQQLMQML